MKRLKLRHDKFVICPYNKNGCSHPRCVRMYGQECYIKREEHYGTNKSKRHKHKHSSPNESR